MSNRIAQLTLPDGHKTFYLQQAHHHIERGQIPVFSTVSLPSETFYIVAIEKTGPVFPLQQSFDEPADVIHYLQKYEALPWKKVEAVVDSQELEYKIAPSREEYNAFVASLK